MNNQQAINLLKNLEQSLNDYCELNDEGKTAFRMAITALEVFGISEQLPSAQPEYRLDEWCTDCKEYDTEKHCCPRFNQVIRTTLDEMKSERKKGRGKWNTYYHSDTDFSYSCNQCGYSAPYQMIGGKVFQEKWNFCPNCGARMTEEDV